MGPAQGQDSLNWGLGPATDRVGFEVLLQNEPALTQIRPVFRGAFDRDGRRTGEAFRRQQNGRDAGHRAPACAIFEHGGMVNAAHHLAAGAVIFGNAQRVTGLIGGQASQPRPGGCGGHGAPTARGVVIGHRGVLGQSGPCAKLVSQGDGCQKFDAGGPGLVRQSQCGRKQRAPDVPLGRVVPIMAIQRVDGHARGQRNTRRAGRACLKEHRCRPAKCLMRMVADDLAEPCPHRACGHTNQVQNTAFGLMPDLGGQVRPLQVVDQLHRGQGWGKLLGHGGLACAWDVFRLGRRRTRSGLFATFAMRPCAAMKSGGAVLTSDRDGPKTPNMTEIFEGNFTQQEPIPDEGIEAALAVLRHGRLHRYNVAAGELSETALLEQEFAALVGSDYALAVASGGYAMATALRALGIRPGDKVLSNAFTLAPVPGAIASLGAVPVFVAVTENLTIDLDDLAAKVDQAGVLLLSHMRGHICDMDRLMEMCDAAGVRVVEDCAHTMGANWRGVPSGRHGVIGCYSCQTYKHVNSGEGGFLVTDDAEIAAKAVMLSGSYMLYERHVAAPGPEVFETVKYETPNISGRMDNLRAAILRPQLRALEAQVERWNARYRALEDGLRGTPGVTLTSRPNAERYVGSSFQFLLLDWAGDAISDVVCGCAARGVELKWFGAPEPTAFTSKYDSWHYAPSDPMPESDRILHGILDLRVPLTFSVADCAQIARIIQDEICRATVES